MSSAHLDDRGNSPTGGGSAPPASLTCTRQLTPVEDAGNAEYPHALRERERAKAGGGRRWRAGVGCSGGGIRSATFCLGFFQGLAQLGLLRHVDYLSTVSGGGYFGSFLGRLFCRGGRLGSVDDLLKDSRSRPVEFLRENGRYLAPNGAGDLLQGAAVALRNWAAVHVVMIVSCLFLLSAFELLAYGALQYTPGEVLRLFAPRGFWVSPVLAGLCALLLVVVVALGWAYWLVPEAQAGGDWLRGWGRVGMLMLAFLASVWLVRHHIAPGFGYAAAIAAGATLAAYGVGWIAELLRSRKAGQDRLAAHVQALRARYTQWLTIALAALAVLLGLGVVDAAGMFLLTGPALGIPSVYAGAAALAGALRPLLRRFMQKGGKSVRLPYGVLAGAVASLLLLAVLSVLATLPHYLAWAPQLDDIRTSPPPWPMLIARQLDLGLLAWATAVLGILAIAIGQMRVFVNRSSLYATYEARLRRAYLGASNPERLRDQGGPVPLALSHPDDGIAMADYHPEQFGGPVHLINATVNETIGGRSQVEQRDRKGLPIAVGPGGVSVGRHHHAVWDPAGGVRYWRRAVRQIAALVARSRAGRFRIFPRPAVPEQLDLSQWVAVSGAAFSTGLGARTSFGFSVLAGLANVRLGYWWDSGIAPQDREGRHRRTFTGWVGFAMRQLLPVQGYLVDEWLARFHGVALEPWYLTDGGHFENTAGYELIRRRLPFIVLCDCGADPRYGFADLGNLVRKARVDYGADIRFFDRADLASAKVAPGLQRVLGSLDDLRAPPDPDTGVATRARAHAALAQVRYAGGEPGVLLVVKPNLTGDEPADVAQYQVDHAAFPQETTLDQFFDEAQWESYRCLGEHIAHQVFPPALSQVWSPAGELTGTGSPWVGGAGAPAGGAEGNRIPAGSV